MKDKTIVVKKLQAKVLQQNLVKENTIYEIVVILEKVFCEVLDHIAEIKHIKQVNHPS